MSETRAYNRMPKYQCMPNVNIPETEKIKLVWAHQEKRIRQPLKKSDGHGCIGEEKKGRPRRRWIDNTREDMTHIKLLCPCNNGQSYTVLARLNMFTWKLAHKRETCFAPSWRLTI